MRREKMFYVKIVAYVWVILIPVAYVITRVYLKRYFVFGKQAVAILWPLSFPVVCSFIALYSTKRAVRNAKSIGLAETEKKGLRKRPKADKADIDIDELDD